MASRLLAGETVQISENFDERIFQRKFILGLKEARDIVVLGSSRSLGIDQSLMPGRSLCNSSVSGASLEDILAIYDLYKESGKLPKVLFLSLDPWLLNKNNGQVRYRSLYIEYARMLKLLDGQRKTTTVYADHKFMEIFSVTYFQSALKVAVKRALNKADGGGTIEGSDAFNIKMPDGSLQDSMRARRSSAEKIDQAAVQYASEKEVYSLGRFWELDPRSKDIFERFIDHVQRDGVEIVFFLSPYHPLAYEKMAARQDTKIIIDGESYFNAVARRKGIRLIGSYDAATCGLKSIDFVDGMHPAQTAIMDFLRNKMNRS